MADDIKISDLDKTGELDGDNDFVIINKNNSETMIMNVGSFTNKLPPPNRLEVVSGNGGSRDNPTISWMATDIPVPNDGTKLLNCEYGFYIDSSDSDPTGGQPGRGRTALCEVIYTDDNQKTDGNDIFSIVRIGNQSNRRYNFVFEDDVASVTGPAYTPKSISRTQAGYTVTDLDVDAIADKLDTVAPTHVVDADSNGSLQVMGLELRAVDSAFVTDVGGTICINYDSLTVALIAAFKSERAKRLALETQMQDVLSRLSALEG